MYIDLKEVNTYNETLKNINKASSIEITNVFIENVKRNLSIAQNIVSCDFKQLSDEEFFQIIQTLYNVSLTEEDYLEIFSEYFDKLYVVDTIKTTMTKRVEREKKLGTRTRKWEAIVQIDLKIARPDNLKIAKETLYTVKEINDMLDANNFIILGEIENEQKNKNMKESEKYHSFPKQAMNPEITPQNKLYYYALKHLKKKITSKKILEDLSLFIENLQKEIDEVKKCSGVPTFEFAVSSCSEELKESGLADILESTSHKCRKRKIDLK